MATFLYIFPHPDDESFGPGPLLAQQRRDGHAVHLLTLTQGEATSQRERLGYSKEKMGAVRVEEMEDVADVLDLSSLTVLDLPDGGLSDLDPRLLDTIVADAIRRRAPDVVVTYPVHGISGHPDHLATHAVVKRVVCRMRADGGTCPTRLAFFTLLPPGPAADRPDHLQHSASEAVDCVVTFDDEALAQGKAALDCYRTYRPVVEAHRPLDSVQSGIAFELFGETHDPRLDDLLDALDPSALPPASPSVTAATGSWVGPQQKRMPK
jgi:LmbE family N-acetylglucosaminyl deacetylase